MSLTITSILALAILRFFAWTGQPAIEESQVLSFVMVASQLLAGIGIYIGRVKAGGITWYGKRK